MLDRSITVGSPTPWGTADYVEIKDNGLIFVSTPSHGGFYVSRDLNTCIPGAWQAASFNQQGKSGWYEEDCDWCMVALTFPDEFTDAEVRAADSTFDHWIAPKLTQEG